MLTLLMMLNQNDEPYLRLHLPVYLDAFRSEGKLNVIAASSDGTQTDAFRYMKDLGVAPISIPFEDWDWSKFLNQMLSYAQARGVTKVLRLDPDELMWPTDVAKIDNYLDVYSLLAFPRYSFFWSRDQVNTASFPDLQSRAFRLDGRVHYEGRIHEYPVFTGNPEEMADIHAVKIHHYGDVGKAQVQRRALFYINDRRRAENLPLLTEVPADQQPGAPTQRFQGRQPLDPVACGKYAPFKE